ncbi:hypothetical protein PFFCH_05643 [Plasmodium falciparum FCH/4]|uniref:Protein kinase domain-containing protein n=1 Tax=Plasmodium falciparum FCH/4 TaxID=1036724 RepID=A0A024VE07_PLAFA|nr:hypothetical protein PFFCH_05643 [Plasmodium falciparum FCH/4]
MSSDIWALGVMVFFMLTGKYPFEGKNTPKVVVLQLKHTKLAVDFLKRLLERNEKKRLTAYQALHHPWITSQVG